MVPYLAQHWYDSTRICPGCSSAVRSQNTYELKHLCDEQYSHQDVVEQVRTRYQELPSTHDEPEDEDLEDARRADELAASLGFPPPQLMTVTVWHQKFNPRVDVCSTPDGDMFMAVFDDFNPGSNDTTAVY